MVITEHIKNKSSEVISKPCTYSLYLVLSMRKSSWGKMQVQFGALQKAITVYEVEEEFVFNRPEICYDV
jgi:hypothetical protein